MATPPTWKSTITQIQPADRVEASTVNTPLSELNQRTGYLKAILDNVTSNEFIFIQNAAVASTALAGHVVYWDSANNRYDSALAAWNSTELNDDGTLKISSKAAVAGILVYKFTLNTGTVVLGGSIKAFDQMLNLFGTASPAAGPYYLSASVAGRVTPTPPPLAIEVLSYLGGSDILMPFVRYEHSTHDHRRYLLSSDNWLPATHGNFPNVPEDKLPRPGAYGYDLESDAEVKGVFTLYAGLPVFSYVYTGAIIPGRTIYKDEYGIWYGEFEEPSSGSSSSSNVVEPSGDIYCWMAVPNSHGPSIVRAITTDTPESLSIAISNGLATVNDVALTDSSDEDVTHYTVVKDIAVSAGVRYKQRGKAVIKVTGSDGISITSSDSAGHGVVNVALTEYADRLIDAEIVNLNNALYVTNDSFIYTAFPKGRTSSMTCVCEVPLWDAGLGTRYAGVELWLVGNESGSGYVPASGYITVAAKVFPAAVDAGVSIPATLSAVNMKTAAGTTVSTKYYKAAYLASERMAVTPGALVQYLISYDNILGAANILLVRQGIRIYNTNT